MYVKLFENPSMHTKVMARTRNSGRTHTHIHAHTPWRLCRAHRKRAWHKGTSSTSAKHFNL